jgi:hypothetical protein
MRHVVLSAFLLTSVFALASPAAAATCKCQKNYSPNGATEGWAPYQTFWECVRKPGTYPRGQHPAPTPCNGQTKRGPA